MPKRSSKNRSRQALITAKNALRGTRDVAGALATARLHLSPDQVPEFLVWAERVSFNSRSQLPAAFPPNIQSLFTQKTPSYYDDAIDAHPELTRNQLQPIADRIILHSDELDAALSIKSKIDYSLLVDDYNHAESLLNVFIDTYGYSIYTIEYTIHVLQALYGLERQKHFAEFVRSKRGKSIVSSLAFFISQRNEPSTHPFRFIDRVAKISDSAPISRGGRAYFSYRASSIFSVSDKNAFFIISREHRASLVDVVDAVSDIIIGEWAETARSNTLEVFSNALCSNGLSNERLNKVLFLNGNADPALLKTRSMKIDECLLQTDYLSPIEPYNVDDPRELWLLGFSDNPIFTNDDCKELWQRLSSDLREVVFDIDAAVDAAADIIKYGLNLRNNYTVQATSSSVYDLLSEARPLTDSFNLRASICSPYLDPWDLLFLPPEALQCYHSALLQRYGSTLTIEFVSWCIGFRLTPPKTLAPHAVALGNVIRCARTDQTEQLIQYARQLRKFPKWYNLAVRWLMNAFLESDKADDFIELAAELITSSENYFSIIPLNRFFKDKSWDNLQGLAKSLSLSIVLDFYWKQTGDGEISSLRRFAIEDYLNSCGVERPSELLSKGKRGPDKSTTHFLSEICVPSAMDLMLAFPTSRTVIEERREICAQLVNIDPANAGDYQDEITNITQTLRLEDGVRLRDQSRVYVDAEGLIHWAERELKEQFERYRALTESRVDFDRSQLSSAIRNFLVNQEPLPHEFFSLPKGEANELLLEIVHSLRRAFLSNSSHGLDAYLSLRVRHGTLSGMLRGPLEDSHLINQKVSGTSRYLTDDYWRTKLRNHCSNDQVKALESALLSFSREYDGFLEDMRRHLQIRGKEFPEGLFDIELNAFHIYLVKLELSTESTLRDVVEASVEVFWYILYASLRNVRHYIEFTFKPNVENSFNRLDKEISNSLAPLRYGEISEGMRTALTEIQTVIDNIQDWFQRKDEAARLTYPISTSIEIAIEAVRTTYRNFNCDIYLNVSVERVFNTASVNVMSDIIFTILDNVHRYSKTEAETGVWIKVTDSASGAIAVLIENDLGSGFDYARAEERLEAIRKRIERGEYKTDAASREGGTGLLKLKNYVDPAGKRPDALDFGFTDHGTFYVEVSIETFTLRS